MANKRVKAGTSKAAKTTPPAVDGLTHQQESFAQLVASGRSQADAYRAAYPMSQEWQPEDLYTEASRLAAHPKVSPRISALRAIITQQAIDAAVVDKAWVIKRLKTVTERCLQSAPVLDRKGKPVIIEVPDVDAQDGDSPTVAVAYEFDPAGANRALELIGKEQGMFIDRKEQGKPGEFATDKEKLRHRADELNVKLGMGRAIRVSKPAVH